MDLTDELWDAFVAQITSLLDRAELHIVVLEKDPENVKALADLRRDFHSIASDAEVAEQEAFAKDAEHLELICTESVAAGVISKKTLIEAKEAVVSLRTVLQNARNNED